MLKKCIAVVFFLAANAAIAQQDSTKINTASSAASACVTVDGVPADGSAGTPKEAPYYGGNWFSSVSAASAKFGRTLVSVGGNACVTSCPANQHWDGSSCVADCQASSKVVSTSCPAGYTGTAYQTATVNCPAGNTSYSAIDTSGCTPSTTCTPGTTTISAACPAGYTGTAYQTATVSCPSGSTTNSAWDTSGCTPTTTPPTCTPSSTTVPTSCPTGYKGTAYQTVNVSCPSGATTYGSLNTSGCSPVSTPPGCTPTNYSQVGACPAGQTGTATRTATQNCDGTTTYGAWDTSACAVVCPATSVTTGACPSPQIGNTTITTTYTGPSCTAMTITDTTACTPPQPITCPATEQFCTYKLASGGDAIWTMNTVTYSGLSCLPTTTTQGLGRYPSSVEPQECGGPPPGCNDANGFTLPFGTVRNICETDLVVNTINYGVKTLSQFQCTSPGFWKLIYAKPGDEITVCP